MEDDILRLYKDERLVDTVLNKYNGDLKSIINRIQNANKPDNYDFRTRLDYQTIRDSYAEIVNRTFETDEYDQFSPEHAQEKYLFDYALNNPQVEVPKLGYIIMYELPFFDNRKGGAVDLVSYDVKENKIHLVEMKCCAMGNKAASTEPLLKPILEIETYTRCVNLIFEHEKEENVLKERMRICLKEIHDIDIPKEVFYKAELVKDILIPKSLYDNSLVNPREKDMYEKYMPRDINILFFNFKDNNFDTSQKINSCAKERDLKLEIYS